MRCKRDTRHSKVVLCLDLHFSHLLIPILLGIRLLVDMREVFIIALLPPWRQRKGQIYKEGDGAQTATTYHDTTQHGSKNIVVRSGLSPLWRERGLPATPRWCKKQKEIAMKQVGKHEAGEHGDGQHGNGKLGGTSWALREALPCRQKNMFGALNPLENRTGTTRCTEKRCVQEVSVNTLLDGRDC